MNLAHWHREVSHQLQRLHFDRLYPGFHSYDFALYDGEQMCLNGEIAPCPPEFLGNTAITYKGRELAIWFLDDTSLPATPEQLAADLVHEMFHCFQREHGEHRFPDDLSLLDDPSGEEDFWQKREENRCLAAACRNADRSLLLRFCEIRNSRLSSLGEAAEQELRVETVEGVAEFVGRKALRDLHPESYTLAQEASLQRLQEPADLIFDPRRISYDVGVIFCLTLEALGLTVKNDFNNQVLYHQNRLTADAAAATLPCDQDFSLQYHNYKEGKQAAIRPFLDTGTYVPYSARICGYDPMNMLREGEFLLCRHFVFLDNGTVTSGLQEPVLLKLHHGSDHHIDGYFRAPTQAQKES